MDSVETLRARLALLVEATDQAANLEDAHRWFSLGELEYSKEKEAEAEAAHEQARALLREALENEREAEVALSRAIAREAWERALARASRLGGAHQVSSSAREFWEESWEDAHQDSSSAREAWEVRVALR